MAEETVVKPKPMVEIGGRPILWHIMKHYSAHGIDEFIVCLGYKGYMIKEYFHNYYLHSSNVTFDLRNNSVHVHESAVEPWRVTLIETGAETMTGGRLKRALAHLGDDDVFCMTYGDGVGDIDVGATLAAHRRDGRLATVTAVQPPGRFGALRTEGDRVTGFQEKPVGDGGWINGGFFVLSPKVGEWIEGDATVWEAEPLERLAAAGELGVHRHAGFWQPMDTLRDKRLLEDLWASGAPPWKTWA